MFKVKQIVNIRFNLFWNGLIIFVELLVRFFIIFALFPVYTTRPYIHKLVFIIDYRKIRLFIVSFYTLGSLVNLRYPINDYNYSDGF